MVGNGRDGGDGMACRGLIRQLLYAHTARRVRPKPARLLAVAAPPVAVVAEVVLLLMCCCCC